MKHLKQIWVGIVMLTAAPLWSQTGANPSQTEPIVTTPDNSNSDDRMLTPPPVSGQSYSIAFSSEERSNYLRGGVVFTTAYSDNVLGPLAGYPISDISYSIAPMVTLEETTPRLETLLTYAPGFTFYQRETDRDEADQNATVDFHYRLSQHVTFGARDNFQKSSSAFNEPDLASSIGVSGGSQGANFSVFAPLADLLRNSGNVGLNYQFSRNSMVGASGTFTNLHYPDPSEVPGLYDTSSQAGSAFYSLRLSKQNYLGAAYQYQRLVAYPSEGLSETQTHAALLFYTFYPNAHLSFSFFGGPQYSDTIQPPVSASAPLPVLKGWSPAAGASAAWQGLQTSVAISYSHVVSGGGGLIGAVRADTASATIRQQITRSLTGTLAGSYAQNDLLDSLPGSLSGHTISATASLQQRIGTRLGVVLGYERLHQDYSDVAIISTTPNTNREFISVSYQFSRPLGQ
jgi:hypothetical protein